MPPEVVLTDKASYFLWPAGDAADGGFRFGALSSIPLDWYAWRIVEIQVDFHVLLAFPVPRPGHESNLWKEVVSLSAALAASDGRYSRWLTAVHDAAA